MSSMLKKQIDNESIISDIDSDDNSDIESIMTDENESDIIKYSISELQDKKKFKNRDMLILVCKERKYKGYSNKSRSEIEQLIIDNQDRKISNNTDKDEVWQYILEKIDYNNDTKHNIKAKEIKELKKGYNGKNQFEPRLLCYQTSSNSRPTCFIENNIYILPITNSSYCLIKQNIYQKLTYIDSSPNIVTRNNDSCLLSIGQSETSTIDNLRYAGVFERDEILGESIMFGPLLNGRHRTPKFSFTIGNIELDIKGVQYEIDSCYETKNKILLLEGKSEKKEIDSFNIRQLYYPYRVLMDNPKINKQIICGFVHELKSIHYIWLFTFEDKMRMDSIKQIGYNTYKFNS